MPDLEKQKETFLALCREKIHREGLEDLLAWLTKSGICALIQSIPGQYPLSRCL